MLGGRRAALLAAALSMAWGCDREEPCPGGAARDAEGACTALGPCPAGSPDTDRDGTCDAEDRCPEDPADDADGDTLCDSDDPCPADRQNDTDGDGVCDGVDACVGDDASGDTDRDGVCDARDACVGSDAVGDADLDGLCDDREVVRIEGREAGAGLGAEVAAAGDVDGDGFADVVASAPLAGDQDLGLDVVYRGSEVGLAPEPAWSASGGPSVVGGFGAAVASAGDVNGDGFADVAVGSTTGELLSAGSASVWLGSASGLEPIPSWTSEVRAEVAGFGLALAAADLNADGFSDLAVGAPYAEAGAGSVFLFLGGPAGLDADPAWAQEALDSQGHLGEALASAGDVNGDGRVELLVGSPNADALRGVAYLFRGAPGGLEIDPEWSEGGEAQSERFGASVAGVGDVDGDGYADFAVGAPGARGAYTTGSVHVYLGGGPLGSADWRAFSPLGQSDLPSFGDPVSAAGDVDGDGFGDVLVGMAQFRDGEAGEGAVFLYLGSPLGLPTLPSWWVASDQADAWFGASAQGAGDVNADGFDDVVVGAPRWNVADTRDVGAVFLLPSGPL